MLVWARWLRDAILFCQATADMLSNLNRTCTGGPWVLARREDHCWPQPCTANAQDNSSL
ncbi:hypothetical protein PF007_g28118 [Phytophthora fragariae]|uniref:Uncharacterized protein n=1 Tax=Phytophthora fragariae TaxID=53985 RepID=A0A6A3Q1X0_9STRA|nr:hypothetical protein PF009_g28700 [Phytophthora fragariae]KAE9067318.1 hypothetical protein PF007_g28118 [Phytophthora fragariae]